MAKNKDNKKTRIANVNTEKKARSFLQQNNNNFFIWSIRSDKQTDWEHEYFGFNSEVLGSFAINIKPILDSYATMTWNAVGQKNSCHPMDVDILDKSLQDRLYELYNENAPETLYQIRLSGKHRIWGFREDSVFYLLFNDPEHKGYPVEKRNT